MSSKINIPNEVFSILENEINAYNISDNDVCAKLFDDALELIKKYEKATDVAEIPTAYELGKACHWLLFLSNNTDQKKHWETVIKLLSASSGVSLLLIRPSVIAIRDDSKNIINTIIEKEPKRINNKQSSDFDLF